MTKLWFVNKQKVEKPAVSVVTVHTGGLCSWLNGDRVTPMIL